MEYWEFNKGEWTEAYVFLRLLGDGRLYGASADLMKDEQTYIDIINIIRDEPDKCLIFERFLKDEIAYVQSFNSDEKLKIVTAPELSEKAAYLYETIKNITAGDRRLKIPEIQSYLEELNIDSPKANLSKAAKEKYGAKTDIIITTEDSFDHIRTVGGFSIKSHLGSSPTLFNSSSTSGFVYRVVGCNEEEMHQLNYKKDFQKIIKSIRENYSLEYVGCRNEIFEQNLRMIDWRMDEILSNAMLMQIGYKDGWKSNSIESMCEALAKENPLGARNPQFFYESKIKCLLFASFAGMTATTEWNGRKKLSGGYIDVDRKGEMLYYRAISDDIFENYLFKHTYIDRPDGGRNKDLAFAIAKARIEEQRELTNAEKNTIIYVNGKEGKKKSKKEDFGYVYQEGDNFYIVVNFKIRFK
ncbi:MAG: HpaII family restriction endonuclease [Prevotella sp.]|nr:HpaII family restriction endonuclease [Prevotella sp.]